MKSLRDVAVVVMAAAAMACSSSSSGGGTSADDGGVTSHDGSAAGNDASTADASATSDASTTPDAAVAAKAAVKIKVPSTYTGTARQIVLVVEDSLPPMGPPAGILLQQNTPAVTAGGTLSLEGDPSGLNGDYYVLAVLYMQGGGMLSPKAGVDYVAQSAAKVHFDGKSIDLGELDLALAH